MKRTIEISASFTGKISTGNFENESPFFSAKEIIEYDEETDGKVSAENRDIQIKIRQQELHTICYSQFKRHADAAYAERIAKIYQDIRFYDGKDGLKYPSVTSIIGMDDKFFVSPDELAQYAARGTIIHKQVEIFLNTGEWKLPKDIAEVAPCYLTVIKGSLGLDLEDVDFRGLYADYPFKFTSLESVVLNDEYRYGGRVDIQCVIESKNPGKWAKVEGVKFDVPTILDIKTGTTLDKMKGLTQQAAYAKAVDGIQQIGLLHLNKDNKCGYSTPVITTNLERYWALFAKKRQDFKNRYAI